MTSFDFLIVGSGAAGAAAAWRLSTKGYKVACLDRGDWLNPANYPSTNIDWELKKKNLANPVASERESEFDYPINDRESPIAICNFNAVGGSTILYSGHFPRFQPRDFRVKSLDGIAHDWPISYGDLKPYFELNEHEMSVSGLSGDPYYPDIKNLLPPVPLGKSGDKIAAAFNSKGWHWWPSYAAISTRSTRGRNACINLGPCNTGCPQGAKSSTDLTYIPKAIANGLVLLSKAAVFEVILQNDRAIGVRYHDQDAKVHSIFSRHVILAASAIGTPRILMNSKTSEHPNGLGNSTGNLGRNLMLHPLGYVEGVFDTVLDTDIGPQGCMLYSLEHYRTNNASHKLGYMMHALRGTGPVETALSIYKRRKLHFGQQLYNDFFDNYKKQLTITLICEDIPEARNRIVLDHSITDKFGVPGVSVQYKLHENSKKLLSNGINNARSLMTAAGAIRSFAYGPVRNSGWHVMGTARMGKNPREAVVNPVGKVHDIDGLYVIDSSCFVTGSCVNPANTIQAVALYLTDQIEQYSRHEI